MIDSVIFFMRCIGQGWDRLWNQLAFGLNLIKESKYLDKLMITGKIS
jgi:hypothetical protein